MGVNTSCSGPPSMAAPQQLLEPRQLLVLQLRARGYSIKQIAELMELDEHQVSHRGMRAAGDFGVATIDEAVLSAKLRSLIV